MQPVEKKKSQVFPHDRLLLLLGAVILLSWVLMIIWSLDKPTTTTVADDTSDAITTVELYSYDPQAVQAITVHMTGEPSWTVSLDESTARFLLAGEDGFLLSEATTAELQSAAASIVCEQLVSDNPEQYTPHLADFGLAEPAYTAIITFADGTTRTLYIGSRTSHNTAWYYMRMAGDDRLLALSASIVDAIFVSRESLWDVTQPTLHKARIDRITLRSGDGSLQAEWAMQCDIDEDDAAEQWRITVPFSYPADSAAMASLTANAANLRLGAYVGPATEENLAACGFTEPRQIIEIHMAAGAMSTTNMDGAVTITDWPESTITFTIGGSRSDMVDYVLYEDSIYVSSHFTVGVFLDIDPADTMNRYPVLIALGNLSSLTVEESGITITYALTRSERVAENNDLVYDEEGNLVWHTAVTRNGEAVDYAAFEAAYSRLIATAVEGTISEGDAFSDVPHTVYTFTDVSGAVHTVALSDYGLLYDAVTMDGHTAFYMEKGVFKLNLE